MKGQHQDYDGKAMCGICQKRRGKPGGTSTTGCPFCKRIRRILEDTVPKVRINGNID